MMAKGADFERIVCRMLSVWWSDGKDRDIFWRNRTRSTKDSGKYQGGDIMSMKSEGLPFTNQFNIELKIGYNLTKKKGKSVLPWDVLDIIDGSISGPKMILQFWTQCKKDAELTKRKPLLICKRHHHDEIICLDSYHHLKLTEINPTNYFLPYIRLYLRNENIVIFRLTHYLDWLSPDTIRKTYETNRTDNSSSRLNLRKL